MAERNGTLGTFGGVFTPSVLTILGLVLFLLVPYVVGAVGLGRALIILALSTLVSVLTSISLAVVATNMRVGGGGEYYLISRTLGIEFGGAIGVVLYLAISVSIAFYAIGFAEALVTEIGQGSTWLIQLVAAGLVLLLAAIAFVGADLATRLQFLVMALLIVALLSFFIGAIGDFSLDQVGDNFGSTETSADVGFWGAFAIFFPAVTGFSQGVAMSGDLRNPSRSITRGTFAAVGLSTVVYLAVLVLLAGVAPAAELVDRTTTIIGDFSLAGWTMIVGVLAATISSALASTMGSPRVLQQLGQDHVLPRIDTFAKGAGPTNNPRRALGVSVLIALATVAVGDLNAIAPIISMFFLATYGMINYATFFEMRAGSTSFRPRFGLGNDRVSLLGTLVCTGAILAINPLAGAVAALVLLAIYSYLRNRDVPDRWTDSGGSHHYTQARSHITALTKEPLPAADWRPCALAFVPRDPDNREHMLTVASWLEGGSGFLTAVRVLEGSGAVRRRDAAAVQRDLSAEVAKIVPSASARVILVNDAEVGVQTLMQSHGLGSIKPNLALFGVRDLRASTDDRQAYGQMIQNCIRFGANVAVLNVRSHAWDYYVSQPKDERTIALWWSDDHAGQLITLLAWMCTRHPDWQGAKITAYVPDLEGTDIEEDIEHVSEILQAARINATVVGVEQTPAALTASLSRATLALAPLKVRRGVAMGPFETPLGMLIESLPLAIMVLSTNEVALDVEPDETALAKLARVTDRLEVAERRAADLDAEAARLLVEDEQLRIEAEADPDDEELQARYGELHVEANAAYRAYIDARVRTQTLVDRAAALSGDIADNADFDPDIWRSSTTRAETAHAGDGSAAGS